MSEKNQIQQLQTEIHQMARDKGFYDEPRSLGDAIALQHSELSEALEAFRKTGDTRRWEVYVPVDVGVDDHGGRIIERVLKPEGVGPELADCVIRIMDTCEHLGIDLSEEIDLKMKYNATRGYRHGGKAL